jgi:hypothetical protein
VLRQFTPLRRIALRFMLLRRIALRRFMLLPRIVLRQFTPLRGTMHHRQLTPLRQLTLLRRTRATTNTSHGRNQ